MDILLEQTHLLESEASKVKSIRISFEYNTYFLWLLENDILIDAVRVNSNGYFEGSRYQEKGNSLKRYSESQLLGQKDLEDKVDYLNKTYPKLFVDNEIEFDYKGFPNNDERKVFFKVYDDVVFQINALLGKKYKIINEMEETFFFKNERRKMEKK